MKLNVIITSIILIFSVFMVGCTAQQDKLKTIPLVKDEQKPQENITAKEPITREPISKVFYNSTYRVIDNTSSIFSSNASKIIEKPAKVQHNYAKRVQENDGCEGSGRVNLTSPPIDVDKIEMIEPMGLMISGHVTPIDHQYYFQKEGKKPYEVRSPADGFVTTIGAMPGSNNDDFRVIIHHTCTLYSIYIHVNKLSPKLSEAVKGAYPGRSSHPALSVKAGEIIAEVTNQYRSFDYSLHDEEHNLTGFIVPSHYDAEHWKIHTADPYDYFVEPLRSQLLAKNIRSAKPRGGKIDYDIDGKMIGNWFKENTSGYAGNAQPYWKTHFAIAPNAYDPSHIIVSLGDFNGEAKQFSVKGNSPDPTAVDVFTGFVKYELVDTEYYTDGKEWDRRTFAKNIEARGKKDSYGTVLMQMIADRKLKLEVFPGKTASEINGFTGNSAIYER